MAAAFFKVFLGLIKSILNIFMAPVNLVVTQFFPNLSSLIGTFTNALNTIGGGGLTYFSSILPPITRTLILTYLGVLVSYYTITISLLQEVIYKIKIW